MLNHGICHSESVPASSATAADSKLHLTFPCLNLTQMSKEDKQLLHQRLYTESMDMIHKFQNLFSATTESLKRQKVSVRAVYCHLVGLGQVLPTYDDLELPAFRRQLPKLREAKTVV